MWKEVIIGAAMSVCLAAQTPAKVDFRRDVLPLFKANCVSCHGPSLQLSGLRLDRRRDAMKGGTIAVIGPGNSAGSRLYHKLIGNPQYGQQMPPTGALKAEQIDLIKNWIDQGAEWPDDVSGDAPLTKPDPKAAALMEALRKGDRAAFQKALKADPKAAKLKGPGGSTPLMYAALYSDVDTMRLLLDKGADPNARNDAGATALMWAAEDVAKARLLIERGADVNARSEDGRTPLIIAAGQFGTTAAVKLLLDRGAKVAVKAPSLFGEETPLIETAIVGNEATFRMLVEHGADVKNAGPIPLAFAMRSGCQACVEMLLKEPKPDLLVPAMFVVSPPLGPAFGVKPLLERGGVASAKSPEGVSILMMAAASGAAPADVIQALIDRGADVNLKGPGGETALDFARRHGQTPVVDLLLKAGAKEGVTPELPAATPKRASSALAAVQRSVRLLQQNDAVFLKKSGCVSCHNNTLTSQTVAAARDAGIHIDEESVQQQTKTIATYLDTWRERALQNVGIPGDSDTVSPILLALSATNYPADVNTDAMARLLKSRQYLDGHWMIFAHRPPIESSDIAVTATSMRALQLYAPPARRAEYEKSVSLAAAWLAKAQPSNTEDRAHQILGLAWAAADKETIDKAVSGLLAEQRADGGWSQIPTLPSDAYATGEALTALLQGGGLKADHAACKRAVDFLLNTQYEDGTWFVKSRAIPLQPYFETGFPYGHDQWISASATNWATTGLALAANGN